MDRRTFARLASVAGLGAIGCRDELAPTAVTVPPRPTLPPERLGPQPPYPTALDRARGVADGIVWASVPQDTGISWYVVDEGVPGHPTDLYTGHAGIVTFLAQMYGVEPSESLRDVLEGAGQWLVARPPVAGQSLYSGMGGRAWTYLELADALDRGEWLDHALELAPGIASAVTDGLPGDVINGGAGRGLLLLRLFETTADGAWLDAAIAAADHMLTVSVPSGDGIKVPSFVLSDGRTVFYTGMSHGSAGAGYFLSRLADTLGAPAGDPYVEGAKSVARWLAGLERRHGAGSNWYRREPDQLDIQQIQWCHGSTGIGIFHAQLYLVTGDEAYLDTARRCAAHVDAAGRHHHFSCQCHGVAGNAELLLKMYRVTAEPEWLALAESFGDIVWSRRYRSLYYPAWPSGDGNDRNNPGLSTGTAGVGWFYLQLASGGELGHPVTP